MQQPRRRILFVARRKLSKPFRPRAVRDGVPKYGVPLYVLCYVMLCIIRMDHGVVYYPPPGLCTRPLVTRHRTLASYIALRSAWTSVSLYVACLI